MGARGPTSKQEGRQRKKPPAVVVHLPSTGGNATIPEPPKNLLSTTRRDWEIFWRSDLSRLAMPVDLPAVERLFEYRDERQRAMRGFRAARLVDGSQGQPVLNPLGPYVGTLEREITALEDRLGLTPLARARLGLTTGQAKLTAHELYRMTEEPAGGEDVIDAEEAEILADFEAADASEPDPPEEPA